jgi:hypothetical protein
MIAMIMLAAGCAALAALVDTGWWATWFSHPAQPRPEITSQGATLWRIMLGVTAVMLGIAPIVWKRNARHPGIYADDRGVLRREQQQSHARALMVIVILALALRAWRITESLWYDEIASWMTYAGGAPSIGAVFGNFLDPINHPFHTLLNFLSVRWFTDSLGVELAFRLPAFLFSLLSAMTVYGLASAACSERVALLAAGLAAALPVSVLEGVEARGYSMMICFAAAMSWMLIEARRVNRAGIWMLYAVVCALGVWSHFVTAFVPIGHGMWLVWRGMRYQEWREAACGFAALALGAAIALTLYAPMLPAMLAAHDMFAAHSASQPTIVGQEGVHALLQMGGSWYAWAALPGLALLLIGVIRIVSKKQGSGEHENARAALEISLIGLPLMLIVVALSGTWVYARFMLFALPGAMLLIALGIDALWRWKTPTGWLSLGAIGFASIGDLAIRPPKQPLRDAVDFMLARRSPEDRILAIGLAHEVLRVYAHDLNLTYSLRHGADLPQKLGSVRPQWIVLEYPRSVPSEVYESIERAGFSLAAHFNGWVDWTNGDVLVYERDRVHAKPQAAEH